MSHYFKPIPRPRAVPSLTELHPRPSVAEDTTFTGYWSDLSDWDQEEESDDEDDWEEVHLGSASVDLDDVQSTSTPSPAPTSPGPSPSFAVTVTAPPLKRRRLAVSVKAMKESERKERSKQSWQAYHDINKLIQSKKTKWEGGVHGLQITRARAIRSLLGIFLKPKDEQQKTFVVASKMAALSHGFAENWGGRKVREWTKTWITKRDLPVSMRGRHRKALSLIDDPAIAAELRHFVRSNKWAMDPKKLSEYSKNTLVPMAVRSEYFKSAFNDELPTALKRYLEVELFPRIHLKPSRGWGISTARRMLKRLGFHYTEHAKGLYFDGHERADVVEYRQKVFLPAMEKHRRRLVEYKVGKVEEEVKKTLLPGERPLVLVAHDEMTAQANDGRKASWIMDGEQPLRKKGVGRGIHQSDVICSSVGWLEEASQTLEYGKNYEGYWTGELFIEQVRSDL